MDLELALKHKEFVIYPTHPCKKCDHPGGDSLEAKQFMFIPDFIFDRTCQNFNKWKFCFFI